MAYVNLVDQGLVEKIGIQKLIELNQHAKDGEEKKAGVCLFTSLRSPLRVFVSYNGNFHADAMVHYK
jgi:hypothetical protein